MATQTERTVVYAAGVVQGIALVTFPAASTILTNPSEYDLSSTQYGTLFLPQVVTAITAALLGAGLSSRVGTKRVYLVGLAASLASMTLLLVSTVVTDDQSLAYGLLLLTTASLGAGFGFTVPALNTLTAAFNPTAVNRSILVLNALLGLGTVLAPVFVAIFDGLGFWWGRRSSPRSCSSACLSSVWGCRCRPRLRAQRRRRNGWRSHDGSGFTRGSRFSTASARP